MTTRRALIMMGLLVLVSACGGGSSTPTPPEPPASDWEVATPDSVGIPAAAISKLLQDGEKVSSLKAMLVVRDARLIGERYYHGGAASTQFPVMSVTKSVSALLIGQALHAKRIDSLAQPLSQLLPEALAAAPGSVAGTITLEQILTMTSGNEWIEESDAYWDQWQDARDKTHYVLGLKHRGNNRFRYDTASSHLTSPILQRIHGINEQAIATRDLFVPLGIMASTWDKDAKGVPFGSFGLKLRTRDLMKIGQTVLERGVWKGRAVLPAAWIDESVKPRHGIGQFGGISNLAYGYLFWSGKLGGKDVNFAWGHGGQFVIMVPALRMVITSNAEADVNFRDSHVQEEQVLKVIGDFLATLS